MFGMGLAELFLVAAIAILFLGPDKLPGALVETAKFFKKIKSGLSDAKETLDNEMKIADLKEEALSYKKQLDDATAKIDDIKGYDITKELESTVKDVEKSEKKFDKKIETIKKEDENA